MIRNQTVSLKIINKLEKLLIEMPKRKSTTEVEESSRKKTKAATSSTAKHGGDKKATGQKGSKEPYPKLVDPTTDKEQTFPIKFTANPPTKNAKGELGFDDYPEFRPNMTPKEVLHAGSFGGTYFRPIRSAVTGKSYKDEAYKELPEDWLKGLNIKKQVASCTYHEAVNTYKVKCGGSLEMWEESGWMHKQDPYGWFQWYCRFFQGRRSADDLRQVGRWLRCAGPTGRWKNNLISKCVKSGCGYDNAGISPVVRQTLQHWGYRLTKEDFEAKAKQLRKKGLA